jgi:hypothetical protein
MKIHMNLLARQHINQFQQVILGVDLKLWKSMRNI